MTAFMLPIAVGVIITVATYWCVAWILARLQFCRLIDKLPGPPAKPVFGNAWDFKLDKIGFAYQMESLWWTYGNNGIFRMWMGTYPLVILTRSITTETVLRSNELITKSSNYDFLKNWLGTGLLTSTGEKWHTRRKILTPAFHFSILNHFIEVFGRQSLILIDELSKLVNQNVSLDIFPFMGRCALDIICESAMGVAVNAQRNHRSEYVLAVNKMTEIQFHYERKPWLWLKPVFYLLQYGYEYDRCMKVLKSFTNRVIADRSEEYRRRSISEGAAGEKTRERKAFLDLLLSMQDEHQLTLEDIREEVDTFMFEGHDTTASGMSWAIFLLGHHPIVQEKLFEEMQSIFGDSDRMPSAEDLKEMKYLECVIKEALRLFPPVPLIARQATEDFTTHGHFVPKGCSVVVTLMSINRDPNVFGMDAHDFRPERFEEEVDVLTRNPYAYIPFSAGPRNCIGQRFAMLEEKAVLSTVVRRFKITSLDQWDAVRPIPDIILRPAFQIAVHLTPR